MSRPLAVLALALLAALAGCVALPGSQVVPASAWPSPIVTDEAGAPIPYATFALKMGDVVTGRGGGGPDGALALTPVVSWDRAIVAATGYEPGVFEREDVLDGVTLRAASGMPEASDATAVLRMLPPHDFGAIALGPEALCDQRNTCGLSEPVIEVAGDGSIYVSSTCCVGAAPPVWVSRDGGATWTALDTPGIREATGIEGDFAIDDAGNVYFTDILVGAMWITSWDKDGSWRHTTPVPFEPLVDRPWVRAGAEDVVYFLYNTGVDGTNFHVSTDGGRTFLPTPVKKFSDPLGTLGQGPERDHLWVVAGFKLYESTDGGATWSDGEAIVEPEGAKDDEGPYNFAVPVVDEAGRVLVAHDWGNAEKGYRLHAAIREPDGAWQSVPVSPAGGSHHMPWPAAGPDGGFVIAWYGTDDDAKGPNHVKDDAQWYAMIAATHDAGASWEIARADALPVAEGPLNRRLLDFLQVDIAPDGAAHLVYAENRDGTNAERTWYARTTVGLGLAPLVFPSGPKADGQADAAWAALPEPITLIR